MPVVACYCATFLAPEMRHIYRQITGLRGFEPVILTRKRREADQFPFPRERLVELDRPSGLAREWRRFFYRRLRKAPLPVAPVAVRQIERELVERRAAVLHIYFGQSGMELLPLLESVPRPCPVVVSFHGADAGVGMEQKGCRESLAAVFELADAILARSESLANQLIDLGCAEEKITIQRAGIPLADWPFSERNFPAGGAWRFVQPGRLIEKKGHKTALQAFAEFAANHPESRLTIAGEGPDRKALEDRVRQLGLDGKVSFAGFVDQAGLRKIYEASHAVLHPSRTAENGDREGVPNAMLEAMATGLPVLATRHGGIPEAVTGGEEGFLVAEGDAAALARRLSDLVADADRWQRMSQAARAAVEAKFEQSKQIGVLEGVYRKLSADADGD